jgi:hypothetical protein
MSHKGRRITAGEKRIISRVRLFMQRERDLQRRISLTRVADGLSEATGLGKRKLAEIHKESAANEGLSESPEKCKRSRKSTVPINVDDFDREAIRRVVHRMYEQKENPTLDKLLVKVRDADIFPDGRTTLFLLLKNMGFRYHKLDDKLFYERRDIIQYRHKYLSEIRRYRRPIVFLDET